MNSDIIKIESEILKVEITLDGGTFSSIIDKRNGEELQFQGDERSWKDKDMVIFPFIGGMPDGKYMVNGAEYQMSRHGFCRHNLFTFVAKTDNEATVKFTSSEETKKIYPYDFTLYLTYKVIGKDEKTSLVDILLFTGRSHQIRVQFSSRGMPLVGDGKYGAKDNEKNISLITPEIFSRMKPRALIFNFSSKH